MAINKSKIKKLESLLLTAERVSADICKSRGLKGTFESRVYQAHSGIIKAGGLVKVVRESVENRALLKRGNRFDVNKLNPEELKYDRLELERN